MTIELGPMKKITAPNADAIVAAASLSEDAQALVKPGMPVRALLDALIDAELMTDAMRVFAYALPKREAVWWACQCARQAQPDKPVPIDAEIIQASEKWVYRPNEQGRRAAMDLAMKTDFDRAAHWTGAAVFWSGGSIAPPDAPPVATLVCPVVGSTNRSPEPVPRIANPPMAS